MMANCFLTIFVEGYRIPDSVSVRQWTKTCVEMVKPIKDQLDGNRQASQPFTDGLVRANVRTETVSAEQDLAAKQSISFSFKKQSLRQMDNLVTVLLKPFSEVLLLAAPFHKTKIAADEFLSYDKAGVGGKNHVRQFFPRDNQFNFATKLEQLVMQPLPLRARQRR